MLSQSEIETKLKGLKPMLSERFYVEKIGYFGSYSRQDQSPESDIGILIEFRKQLLGIAQNLEN